MRKLPHRQSLDPVLVSPDVYTVFLENDAVRVLDMRLDPGEKDGMHNHPESIICALTDGQVFVRFADDTTRQENIEPGSIVHQRIPIAHSVENKGEKLFHCVIIELKSSYTALTRWANTQTPPLRNY